ncbi:class E sortase [Arcanobacterium hippocoleae]|uniref:class E sortase n=1 Tax=Arcanobacterium hippocoleae TaxID=149017 RepID=UPI003341D0CC
MNSDNMVGNSQLVLQLPRDAASEYPDGTEKKPLPVRSEPRHARNPQRRKRGFFSTLLLIIGELLMTAGIVIGLFVVWTIWWTNVVSNHALEQETIEIQEQFGELPPVKAAPAQAGEPPKVAPVGNGKTIGIIRIPAFGLDNQTPIKEGVDKWILDQGVFSHYEETAMPGEIGNFATAAHRDIYGSRLRDVHKLEAGMPVIVETQDAFLIYKILSYEIVTPKDVYTIAPDPFAAKSLGRAVVLFQHSIQRVAYSRLLHAIQSWLPHIAILFTLSLIIGPNVQMVYRRNCLIITLCKSLVRKAQTLQL